MDTGTDARTTRLLLLLVRAGLTNASRAAARVKWTRPRALRLLRERSVGLTLDAVDELLRGAYSTWAELEAPIAGLLPSHVVAAVRGFQLQLTPGQLRQAVGEERAEMLLASDTLAVVDGLVVEATGKHREG